MTVPKPARLHVENLPTVFPNAAGLDIGSAEIVAALPPDRAVTVVRRATGRPDRVPPPRRLEQRLVDPNVAQLHVVVHAHAGCSLRSLLDRPCRAPGGSRRSEQATERPLLVRVIASPSSGATSATPSGSTAARRWSRITCATC